MRTLFLRVRRSSETALVLARYFERHPALTAVLYPGLPSHPGHDIAARQMIGGFGGMLSIRVWGGESAAMAVTAGVKVFKRATSLGGVESLIEHRRRTEGPSSPVPDDLLRLSIGLEAPEDLIADLESALANVERAPVRSAATLASAAPHPPAATSNLMDAVVAVVERTVVPLVIARGGAVRVAAVQDGVVTLEPGGSPGALLPLVRRIEALLRSALPQVTEVRFASANLSTAREAADGLTARVRQILDDDVNPALAAHGGRVHLVGGVEDGRVRIRLEGGCQGCSVTEVTLRQGIEPLLRARIPEVVAVVDVTDHGAGTNPFYAPGKR
jgi:Fe-S cluster biogenesis protein NfuA